MTDEESKKLDESMTLVTPGRAITVSEALEAFRAMPARSRSAVLVSCLSYAQSVVDAYKDTVSHEIGHGRRSSARRHHNAALAAGAFVRLIHALANEADDVESSQQDDLQPLQLDGAVVAKVSMSWRLDTESQQGTVAYRDETDVKKGESSNG